MARAQTTDTPQAAEQPNAAPSELIPGWLALTVLVLLLAVAALGGYLLRGALMGNDSVTPQDYAIEDWESAVASEPDNPENLLALGYSYQQAGRLEEALELYDSVLVLDTDNSGAMYNKGVVLLELGRAKDAEAVLWDLLEMAPDHVLAAKALGEYYVAKKHYKSALVALEPVIAARPEYADLQYLAGYSCEQLGLRDPAVNYYRGALKYNPGHPGSSDGLARLGEAP
ncbi:MAG: tetratricopeptide repeat protein [Coriobacteriia bacterium]|nr:tetratricopeptide repeat protein [Coriobacteriia bacterium]